MKINFGILGAGRISKIHCHNIYNNPKAKILKIYDINNKSSESLAKKYINPNRMYYLIVGDAKTQLDKLGQLGFGNPILLNPEQE